MSLPFAGPLTVLDPPPRVVPEPLRRGDPGGPSCRICTGRTTPAVWSDEHFTLHPPTQCSLPGTVWIASRQHHDSFVDLPASAACALAPLLGRLEKAILARGDVGRVHVMRWGDGGAHFHLWLMPRPLGMLEAQGPMLPIWEDAMPNVDDHECLRAARQIADCLAT